MQNNSSKVNIEFWCTCRPVKFEDSEVEVGVDIGSDRTILRKFIISQPFHKVKQIISQPFKRSKIIVFNTLSDALRMLSSITKKISVQRVILHFSSTV